MTINKAQGQTLNKVGLLLRSAPFTHGQYYVALSRATNKNNVRIAFGGKDELNGEIVYSRSDGRPGQIYVTSNIVYKSIIRQANTVGTLISE